MMESIQPGGKYNLYSRISSNDNKTNLPARKTTLGYVKMELIGYNSSYQNIVSIAKIK